jgi:hypothetical protein
MPRAIMRAACALVSVLLVVPPTYAQDRPPPVVDVEAGGIGFADDGVVFETLVGGVARWYLLPTVSVGPELVYIGGNNHSHLVVTGNVIWDVLAAAGQRPRALTPFVVAGAGLFQTRETFVSGPFRSTEGAFTLGGGVRAAVADRMTLGVDARLGWEPHFRITGFVGFALGD